MKSFTCQLQPTRIVFGVGAVQQLVAEIDRLACRRALVLATAGQIDSARRIAELLGDRSAGIFAKAVMHVPIESAREARDEARRLGADCAIAVGGGSTTGLAKAIALDSGLPIIAIPTTYSGSEITPIYGLTDGGVKKTGRDARVLPRTVVYDPELSVGLPLGVSVCSGLNAIAHAAEALYAQDANPITSLMAEEGARAMAVALPRLAIDPTDLGARGDALCGAWLCGSVLGQVAMGLHHKLCHTLGGSFNLPHAAAHSVILPHALACNAAHAPEAMVRLTRALGTADAALGVHELALALGAPTSLRSIGMPESGLDLAADLAVATPYPNPRPLDRTALRELLQRAFDGAPPIRI
jgi:alcohol dehydrogenase class IV